MTKHKKTGRTRAVAFVLAAAMLCGMLAGFGRAESVGVCTSAMEKCLGTGLGVGVSLGIWGIFTAVGSCVLGYDFCRKYVQPKEK